MNGATRAGEYTSGQIAKMGSVTNLTSANFSITGVGFQVKNDGTTSVTLEVQLWGMDDNTYVTTVFEVGWNPEIVKTIKLNASAGSYNLKWGY